MMFVLVNGRTLCPKSFCALCREPMGETYLREIATRVSYCSYKCYLNHWLLELTRAAPRFTSAGEGKELLKDST